LTEQQQLAIFEGINLSLAHGIDLVNTLERWMSEQEESRRAGGQADKGQVGRPLVVVVEKPGQARSARQARVAAPMGEQFKYTIQQAAQRLGCSPRSIHNRCAEGKLHKRYENKKPYILHSDITNYLRTLPRIPTASAR
jgi:hypothetical protein